MFKLRYKVPKLFLLIFMEHRPFVIYVVGQAVKLLKIKGKVSLANAENKPPYRYV